MRNQLQSFCKILRDAEIPVSLSSEMDMLKAVIAVGIANRNRFKNVLKLTLIKNSNDLEKFQELFDLFWGKETETKSAENSPLCNDLSLPAKIYATAAVTGRKESIKKAASDVVQRYLVSSDFPKPEDVPDCVEKSLLVYPGREEALSNIKKSYSKTKEVKLINKNLVKIERAVEHTISELVVEKYGHSILPQITKNHALKEQPFIEMNARQRWEMMIIVQRLIKTLAFESSRRYMPGSEIYKPNFRKLYKQIVKTELPIPLYYLKKKKLKLNLVVLLDMSGSVKYVSELWIEILNAIKSAWKDVTVIGFTNIPSLLYFANNRITNAPPFKGYSNYGNVFAEIEKKFNSCFSSDRTALMIFGDARNNRNDANINALRKIAYKCRRVLWLNPEPRKKWDTGDSIQSIYSSYCHSTMECSTITHLEHFAETISKGVL